MDGEGQKYIFCLIKKKQPKFGSIEVNEHVNYDFKDSYFNGKNI